MKTIEKDFASQLEQLWDSTWRATPGMTAQKLLLALSHNFGMLQMVLNQLEKGDKAARGPASSLALLLATQSFVLARFIGEQVDDE